MNKEKWENVRRIVRDLRVLPVEEIPQPKKGLKLIEMLCVTSTVYYGRAVYEPGVEVEHFTERYSMNENGDCYMHLLNAKGKEVKKIIPIDFYNGVKHCYSTGDRIGNGAGINDYKQLTS
jgi:hypothetical protein